MKQGPPDFEIAEIGLDNILENIIPGSDSDTKSISSTNTTETSETAIDDPLGW